MTRRSAQLIPLLVAVLVGVAAPAQAQVPDDTNTEVSLGYEFRRRIKERLRNFGDLVYERRIDPDFPSGSQNEWSTTGGLSYDINKRLRFEGGLGLYYTDRPDLTDTLETRLWQAATVDWPNGPRGMKRFTLHHRFRLEERFRKTEDWSFALRFRYRLAISLPLNHSSVGPRTFYLPLKAEFFFPLGDDIEKLFAKQARYTAGVGYVFSKSWTIELRFAQQRLRDTIDADIRVTDHLVQLRVKSSFRIADLIRGR